MGLKLNHKEQKKSAKKKPNESRSGGGGGRHPVKEVRYQAKLDPLVNTVRSSTGYYLYRHFKFANEQEMMMAEGHVRTIEKGCNELVLQPEFTHAHLVRAHSALEEAVDTGACPLAAVGLPDFLKRYQLRPEVNQSPLAVASALLLVLATDAGLIEGAKDLSGFRHQLLADGKLKEGEVDHVMEVQFLKDAVIQSLYAKQSVLTEHGLERKNNRKATHELLEEDVRLEASEDAGEPQASQA